MFIKTKIDTRNLPLGQSALFDEMKRLRCVLTKHRGLKTKNVRSAFYSFCLSFASRVLCSVPLRYRGFSGSKLSCNLLFLLHSKLVCGQCVRLKTDHGSLTHSQLHRPITDKKTAHHALFFFGAGHRDLCTPLPWCASPVRCAVGICRRPWPAQPAASLV